MRNGLRILLSARRTVATEYFIYNAYDFNSAVCYLRAPALGSESTQLEWIEWAQGARAVEIAEEITRMRGRAEMCRIFEPTIYYDLYSEPRGSGLLERIVSELERQRGGFLSDLNAAQFESLLRACFGQADKTKSA